MDIYMGQHFGDQNLRRVLAYARSVAFSHLPGHVQLLLYVKSGYPADSSPLGRRYFSHCAWDFGHFGRLAVLEHVWHPSSRSSLLINPEMHRKLQQRFLDRFYALKLQPSTRPDVPKEASVTGTSLPPAPPLSRPLPPPTVALSSVPESDERGIWRSYVDEHEVRHWHTTRFAPNIRP